MADPYRVLGVDPKASEEEIKKAYRSLSRMYHPDSNIGKSDSERAAAEEKFKEVQKAYKAIMSGQAYAYTPDNESYGGRTTYNNSQDRGPYGGPFAGYSGSYDRQQGAGSQGGRSYGNPYNRSGNYNNGYNNGGYNNGGNYNNNFNNGRPYGNPYSNTSGAYYNRSDSFNMYQTCETFLQNRMYGEALRILQDIPQRDGRWYYYSAMANAGLGNQATAIADIEMAINLSPNNMEYRRFAQRLTGGNWYTEVGRSYRSPDAGENTYCTRICLASVLCQCCGGGSLCRFIPVFCI